MKKIFFLFLSFFISQFNFVKAGTICASLCLSPDKKQTVILLGDQHTPSCENTNKELWSKQEVRQFELFINAINLQAQKCEKIEILIENLATMENQGIDIFRYNNKINRLYRIAGGKTKLQQFISNLYNNITPQYFSLLSLICFSIEKYHNLYKNILIQDLDEQKIRFKWKNAIKETQKEIIESTQIMQEDKVEDKEACEYITDVINDFFDKIEPFFDNIEKLLKQYIEESNNEQTKIILKKNLENSTEIWNKMINDFNNIQKDQDSLGNLLSLFSSQEAIFAESKYYNKSNKFSGKATPFDGICEVIALWRITKIINEAKKIFVFCGEAHTKRLENYLEFSGYKKLKCICKKMDLFSNNYFLIKYDTICKWAFPKKTYNPDKNQPEKSNTKKRKNSEEKFLILKKKKSNQK